MILQPAGGWTDETCPPSCVPVVAYVDSKSWIRAIYCRRFAMEANDEFCDFDTSWAEPFDENEDEWFFPAGWYVQENDEEQLRALDGATIVAWSDPMNSQRIRAPFFQSVTQRLLPE